MHPVPSLGGALLVLTCLFSLGLGVGLPLLVAQLQVGAGWGWGWGQGEEAQCMHAGGAVRRAGG